MAAPRVIPIANPERVLPMCPKDTTLNVKATVLLQSPLFYRGFIGGASDKEPACKYRRHKRCSLDPWVGKIPWSKDGNPLQYSCLENGQRSLVCYSL